jgi:hypothetical protein
VGADVAGMGLRQWGPARRTGKVVLGAIRELLTVMLRAEGPKDPTSNVVMGSFVASLLRMTVLLFMDRAIAGQHISWRLRGLAAHLLPTAAARTKLRWSVRLLVLLLPVSCGWDPSRPFDRDSPVVREALSDLDAGDASAAASRLQDYLSTGVCKDGSIGTPDILQRRPDGTFDLGLSLFRVGEHFGRRFGEEEIDSGVSADARDQRHAQVECARRLVQVIGDSAGTPGEVRARARFLEGNLAFLDGAYEDAVRAYDRALVLAPGTTDGGDPVGRDAAWNRSIALRRIEDRKDAGADASQDASRDASKDSGSSHPDGGDGAKDGGQDGRGPDDRHDAGPPPPPPDAGADPREAGAPPPPSPNEDERMLDQLENAPTLQQEEAKRAGKKHVRGMADK